MCMKVFSLELVDKLEPRFSQIRASLDWLTQTRASVVV